MKLIQVSLVSSTVPTLACHCTSTEHSCTAMLVMMSSFTAIRDLRNVQIAIINLIDWMDIGLQLGLSKYLLDTIKMEQKERVKDCRREMLVAWLKKKDDVSSVGNPSWSVLKAALRKIGEEELAENILS